MGKAQEIGSQLLYDAVIAPVVLLGEGGCLSVHVLMHSDSVKLVRFPVEKESPLRIHLHGTVAYLGLGRIKHTVPLVQLDADRVEIRIVYSVPEADAPEAEIVAEIVFRESPDIDLAVGLVGQFPVPLQKLDPDKDIKVLVSRIHYPGLDVSLNLP